MWIWHVRRSLSKTLLRLCFLLSLFDAQCKCWSSWTLTCRFLNSSARYGKPCSFLLCAFLSKGRPSDVCLFVQLFPRFVSFHSISSPVSRFANLLHLLFLRVLFTLYMRITLFLCQIANRPICKYIFLVFYSFYSFSVIALQHIAACIGCVGGTSSVMPPL